MRITPDTKLREVLDAYPFLGDFLKSYNPVYRKLESPMLYQTVGRFATMRAVAEMGGVDVGELLEEMKTEIAKRGIAAHEGAGVDVPMAATGRERRQEVLKEIVRDLHEGATVDQVKARFDEITQEVDAAEIAAMEQALIAEGLPVEEVQRLCDVHVTVFKEALDATETEGVPEVPLGHPIYRYRQENQVAAEITESLRCLLPELEPGREGSASAVAEAAEGLQRLAEIDAHYLRKENLLFPLLERHGVEGPTKVMWGIDDDIRARIASDLAAAREEQILELKEALPETLRMVDDMVYKEERILFPTALETLSAEEWNEVASGEEEIGYSWITPAPSTEVGPARTAAAEPTHLPLETGALTLEQVNLLFGHLPLDITFVDAEDRVRFYSGGDRIFPRTPAVIGREVRNCHPPKSVDRVERIITEFKSGTRDVAEFWLQHNDRFVHIRYFAVRDGDGAYHGVLEIVQDVTGIRSLEGERRILD